MASINTKDNVDWHYDVYGSGEEVVLFLHGWAADMRVWYQQIRFFQDKYRVIALDLPGHGRSSWQTVDLKEIAEDINFLLNTLGIYELNVVGSSLGGLIALQYTDLFPQKVKKLILVGTLPKFARSQDYPYGLEIPRIRELRMQVKHQFPDILNIFFRSLFTIQERETVRYRWMHMFQKTGMVPEKEALLRLLGYIEKEDLTGVLPGISQPVYLMGGSEDYICSREAMSFMQDHLTQAKTVLFEHCGHFPFLSVPQEFNRALKEFLIKNGSNPEE